MRDLLASNLEEVNKLTQLSQTLLQLSQLDHGSIIREKVSLQKAIETVIGRFKSSSRIVFTSSKISSVYANELNVEELLTILIDNALKYSPQESTIHVHLVKRKGMSGFEVKNKGKGIAGDILPHIFDRFYRADSSRTGGSKRGYGLGLSLAKKIVELHDGELTVTSATDQETTFRVLLPNYSRTHH
jgi:signal transduction histidine kinase